MKLISLSALAFAALLGVECASVDERSAAKTLAVPPQACADPHTAVALRRAWNGAVWDHFYTTDVNELNYFVSTQGYTDEGVTGWVFSSYQPGTTPLYRLWSSSLTDHFYTISASERSDAILFGGYVDQGITGYVYPTTSCGGITLWRTWHNPTADHLYTTSVDEKDRAVANGATLQGNAGFILPY